MRCRPRKGQTVVCWIAEREAESRGRSVVAVSRCVDVVVKMIMIVTADQDEQ